MSFDVVNAIIAEAKSIVIKMEDEPTKTVDEDEIVIGVIKEEDLQKLYVYKIRLKKILEDMAIDYQREINNARSARIREEVRAAEYAIETAPIKTRLRLALAILEAGVNLKFPQTLGRQFIICEMWQIAIPNTNNGQFFAI